MTLSSTCIPLTVKVTERHEKGESLNQNAFKAITVQAKKKFFQNCVYEVARSASMEGPALKQKICLACGIGSLRTLGSDGIIFLLHLVEILPRTSWMCNELTCTWSCSLEILLQKSICLEPLMIWLLHFFFKWGLKGVKARGYGILWHDCSFSLHWLHQFCKYLFRAHLSNPLWLNPDMHED